METGMYTTKVYKALGGNELVVDSGGKITMKPGSTLDIEGEIVQSITFDEDYFTINDGEVTLKTEIAALLTIVAGIPDTDPADDGVSIWNDGGVLKVSGASAG
jgi:hypothetical protein